MRKLIGILTIALLTTNCFAENVDFEDIDPLNIPTTPFTSGGLDFIANNEANAVFPAGFSASDNGTQVFGWCGSGCGDTQIISATTSSGDLFTLESIDVGNLAPAGGPLGWVPEMTVEVVGYQASGGVVEQSLAVFENVFTTYTLTGFTNLTHVEFFAPPTVPEFVGTVGNPDPVIDNISYSAVPEPTSAALLSFAAFALVRRRR